MTAASGPARTAAPPSSTPPFTPDHRKEIDMIDALPMDLHYTDGRFEPIQAITESAGDEENIDAFMRKQGWAGCFTAGEEFSPLRPVSWRRRTETGSWQYLLEFSNGMEYSQYILIDSFPEWMDLLARWAPAIHADCVFCLIVDGLAPATIVHAWDDALAIVPLDPVVDGHLLVIPRVHFQDATESPNIAAGAMRRAASIAEVPCNIITSAGGAATQTIWHLHIHVVPRQHGDGLALPWTGQAAQ